MEGATSAMDAIITASGKVLEMVGTILTTITSNEVLAFLLAAGFVSVGIGVFGKLKRVAKG